MSRRFLATFFLLVLALPAVGSAQRHMNIEREQERVARDKEREAVASLTEEEVEQRAEALLVIGADGSVVIHDRKELSQTTVEVLEIKLGKAEVTGAGEPAAEGRWQVRRATAEAKKGSKKVQLRLQLAGEKKPDKLTCLLDDDLPPESGAARVFILPGDELDYHCRAFPGA